MLYAVIDASKEETEMRRSGPRSYPNAPVIWEEVWEWARDIEEKWGYYIKIEIHPPLPSMKKVRFCVQVFGRKLKVGDPSKDSTVQKYRNVEQIGVTAEMIALQLLVELHQKLDNEEYEAERAALEAGAMF
jgi:hypothetical protein